MPDWQATNELRTVYWQGLDNMPDGLSMFVDGRKRLARMQQKWIADGQSEWRDVPVMPKSSGSAESAEPEGGESEGGEGGGGVEVELGV